MTLESAYYISQMITAVAVVVSLIYLAIQVRQAERNQRVLVRLTRAERGLSISAGLQEPYMAGAWEKAMADDIEGLSAQEVGALANFLRRMAVTYLEDQAQHDEALLSDAVLDGTRAAARRIFAAPINRAIWISRLRDSFAPADAAAFEVLAIIDVPLRTPIGTNDRTVSLRATRAKLLADAAAQVRTS